MKFLCMFETALRHKVLQFLWPKNFMRFSGLSVVLVKIQVRVFVLCVTEDKRGMTSRDVQTNTECV
jgi:hypothetical protein